MLTEVLRRAFREGPFASADAARVLGIRDVSSTLSRLKAAGVIERTGRGMYRFASLDKWEAIDSHLAREAVRTTRQDREQVIEALARRGWESWLEQGRLVRLASRRYRWNRVSAGAGGARSAGGRLRVRRL